MIADIIATDNLVHFNIQLAHLVGLKSSVYISEIINIQNKAIRKKKIKDGYFELDRKYLTARTTLSESEQKEIEKDLSLIYVIKKDGDSNRISLDVDALANILITPDDELKKAVSKVAKIKDSKQNMKEMKIRQELKNYIDTTNDELRQAYEDWIDSVFDKEGWMSKSAVQQAQNIIDAASDRYLDIALSIIRIASINGYRDMTWAVNAYRRDASKLSPHIHQSPSMDTPSKITLGEEEF